MFHLCHCGHHVTADIALLISPSPRTRVVVSFTPQVTVAYLLSKPHTHCQTSILHCHTSVMNCWASLPLLTHLQLT